MGKSKFDFCQGAGQVKRYNDSMQSVSEIALLAIIWTMTLIGLFFGIRAAIRKRKK